MNGYGAPSDSSSFLLHLNQQQQQQCSSRVVVEQVHAIVSSINPRHTLSNTQTGVVIYLIGMLHRSVVTQSSSETARLPSVASCLQQKQNTYQINTMIKRKTSHRQIRAAVGVCQRKFSLNSPVIKWRSEGVLRFVTNLIMNTPHHTIATTYTLTIIVKECVCLQVRLPLSSGLEERSFRSRTRVDLSGKE